MEYLNYSDIPTSEMKIVYGADIIYKAQRYDIVIFYLKNDKIDHRIFNPLEELVSNKKYCIYSERCVYSNGQIYIFDKTEDDMKVLKRE